MSEVIYKLSQESKDRFWEKVSPEIKNITKAAGFDPTNYVVWNEDIGNWTMREQDLVCWLKIVYPKSDIITTLVEHNVKMEDYKMCQYKTAIYRDDTCARATEIHGPVIVLKKSDFVLEKNGQFFDSEDNVIDKAQADELLQQFNKDKHYIATARTMSISTTLRHMGFGCQFDPSFTAEPPEAPNKPLEPNNTTNKPSENDSTQKKPTETHGKPMSPVQMTLEMAYATRIVFKANSRAKNKTELQGKLVSSLTDSQLVKLMNDRSVEPYCNEAARLIFEDKDD